MARTYFRIFQRDDKTEVECEYSVEGGGPASGLTGPMVDYDPGSGAEVCVIDCWLVADANNLNAQRLTLTDEESDRFAREVNEDPATFEMEESDYD